ncbi:hypothetical protein [Streptomyces sp. NPDC048825]|uniref:hypothetical protein n=1 Tax=Streptomyces sp. NPDC048825 TaxID=3365592 RepID=UPI0037118C4A
MTGTTERDDFLDFPGADELIAAGTVAPPSADSIAAVREGLVLLADRETEQAHTATAHDSVVPLAAARRGVPAASLAPPEDLSEDPLVVLDPDEPGTPPRRRRLPLRARVLATAAAVAAIAVGAAVYPVLDVGGKPPSAASAASEFLNDMAKVSAEEPATHGKYWMVHYWAKDGRRTATVTVYSDRAGATWIRNPNGKVSRSGHNIADWNVGDRRLPWTEFDQLPTEPEKLKARFSKNAEARFEQIMPLLAESPASPDLRSALFQIVAETPGVTMTPEVKDSRGRPGTEIVLRDTRQVDKVGKPGAKPVSLQYSLRYVIDPDTSRVLESGGAGANPLVRTTYLEVGWTNHIS